MRIMISGGGTGGHIYPALALIKRMKELDATTEVMYVGTEKGLESRIVPKAGIPFETIDITGFKRSLSLDNFKTVAKFLKGVKRSKELIRDFKPDVVVGTGGYVCAPLVYAAAKLGVPSMIHEQNSVAGIANKFLGRYVDKVGICFEEAASAFPKDKVVFTGNPRAEEMSQIGKSDILGDYQLEVGKPTVLVFGGSRGALKINRSMVAAIPEFAKKPYQVLFVTGEVHYEAIKNEMTEKQIAAANVSVQPFVYNMPEIYGNIDLIVARSGATTIAEVTAIGLPSILIPSPYVTNDHQTKNAKSLVDHQAALLLTEENLDATSLVATIDELMLNDEKRQAMAQESKKLGIPDAATRIIHLLEEIKK